MALKRGEKIFQPNLISNLPSCLKEIRIIVGAQHPYSAPFMLRGELLTVLGASQAWFWEKPKGMLHVGCVIGKTQVPALSSREQTRNPFSTLACWASSISTVGGTVDNYNS